MRLRYGLNPHQDADADALDRWPLRVVAGQPSYVNLLDSLTAWQLVREASTALGGPVATSFKHVSPAGAATDGHIDTVMTATWGGASQALSPVARAYVRARDCDPQSSFGDFVAVSEPVDESLAAVLAGVVSDGVIAPGYSPGTTEILRRKKAGRFVVLEADPDFAPPEREARELFGVRLAQNRDAVPITREALATALGLGINDFAVRDLVLASIAARFTQSNSVVYAKDGMVLGVGAGQQSRIDCTKIAGAKVDTWWLRRHPLLAQLKFPPEVRRQARINWVIRLTEGHLRAQEQEQIEAMFPSAELVLPRPEQERWLQGLGDVSLASDGSIPFRDNVDEAHRHGVRFIADPGGSVRSSDVEAACAEYEIRIGYTGVRLFRH